MIHIFKPRNTNAGQYHRALLIPHANSLRLRIQVINSITGVVDNSGDVLSIGPDGLTLHPFYNTEMAIRIQSGERINPIPTDPDWSYIQFASGFRMDRLSRVTPIR